jgi:putative Holliday junction resolvase
MKVLGLDIGDKRIGIAISDELGYTAQGMRVLTRSTVDEDIEAIDELIKEQKATEIVVGLPKNMDGSLGEAAQKVMSFANKIEEALSVPVILWDERLTTAEATRLLVDADISRSKRRMVVDKLAAVLILQGYLDSLDLREGGGAEG